MNGAGLEASIVVRRAGEDDRPGFELDIDLSIAPGSTAALLGPNGAGKSTTVDALAGVVPLDAGRIALEGRVLDGVDEGIFVPSERRKVGVVFQDYLLFDHLDVLDNVAFAPASAGLSRSAARDVARKWIERFDLGDLASRTPPQLSGGQRQRVALVRTLAAEPDLLLLDEPLAALDVATRAHLRVELGAHLGTFAGPRLLITHEPADAFLLADHIHVLEEGRITQSGTPDDIRRRPATAYVAALAGLNFLTGRNQAGTLRLDAHALSLQTADTHTNGSVLITINPTAIALHSDEPHGSPRNAWPTRVRSVEPLGEITRVMIDQPLPLSIDVTPSAATSLELAPGLDVWASVKATEISVHPA